MIDSQFLIEDAIHIFLNNQREKLDKILIILMKYKLKKEGEDYKKIYRFFHNIRGTAAMFELNELSDIAGKYEAYLENYKGDLSNDYFGEILNGLACIYKEILCLKDKKCFNNSHNHVKKNIKEDIKNKTILIVDDDMDLLLLLENVLKKQGYNVIKSLGAKDVISILNDQSVDMVILDIIMPDKNGFELLNQIKKENINIPIVFLTAKNVTRDRIRALKEGAEAYITKPFQVEELIVTMENIFKKVDHYKVKISKDNLTGVYSKDFFNENIKNIENSLKYNDTISVAFVDFDYFKSINDRYGHLAGDYALSILVNELKKSLREEDEIYRFGGDEFLILFKNLLKEQVCSVMQRCLNNINKKNINYRGNNIKISFSAGITTIVENESIKEALDRADRALYVSKDEGRGRITYLKKEYTKKKVLLIDDSNMIVRIIKDRLVNNYDVEYSNNGDDGIKIYEKFKPDLVITDYNLPGMDGCEICDYIKNTKKDKKTKVFILSCNCTQEDIDECFEKGADDYIIKPFCLADLEKKVDKILNG
ncbi:MAG: response regulator [Tepidibacter sp.]|uniref:response regulator n=1 Tax=Tepidibacter sp. TaxID=2529387 RepID=UPI0025E28FA9|nr:response regulator [Tepidibacter sp.]MCT4509148.1 response regulator [Tepidibacter sp.]